MIFGLIAATETEAGASASRRLEIARRLLGGRGGRLLDNAEHRLLVALWDGR